MTDPDGLVWSWEGEAETTRREQIFRTVSPSRARTQALTFLGFFLSRPAGIAFTERMMDPKLTLDGKFAYQKIYQELDYLASGVLTIPPGGEKGLKSSKDNSYVCSPASYHTVMCCLQTLTVYYPIPQVFCCLQGSVSVTVHRTRFAIGP